MENRLPGFFASVCLHLAAAALLLFTPAPAVSPVSPGGIAVSGYVTLGKPGAAPREARDESRSGSGPVLPEKTPPPPDASASATPKEQTPPAAPPPPEPRAAQEPQALEPPVPPAPPQEAVKSAPEAPLRDPEAVPVPKTPEKAETKTPEPPKPPEKAEPQKKVESPKPPQKAEAPKKTEPVKKTEPPKKTEAQKKTPAARRPQTDNLAGALAELSREVVKSNPRRGGSGPGTQNQGGSRSLSGALAELGKEADGRSNGPSGSGPGGDGGDGYGVLGAYQDSIISRVRPNWSLPARADRRSYTAVVNIKIDKDGTIMEARIIRSSGNGFFDASVMQAVAATKTLEPPPHPDYADINISFTPESLGRQ
ncbi:MAG: cell envelope integrity protein TolA [Desulfovibrio sp.]|nr:cell envelope integrity protein TolA [Desulfovibrio sp.]